MIEDFRENLALWWRYASTWAAFVVSCGFGYWLTLPPEQQAAILAAWPLLKFVAPAAGFIAYMAARGWPQPDLDRKLAERSEGRV